MSQASMTAGVVGKFGQSSFTSVSNLGPGKDKDDSSEPKKPSKFFKSRNKPAPVLTDTIAEEEEEELEEENLHGGDETVLASATPTNVTMFQTPGGNNTVCSESNILVGVRIRPSREGEENILDIDDTQVVVDTKIFNFDLMFDGHTSQAKVFDDLVKDRVDSVINGFNATVFAYGQTGTGKTFTMGTSNNESMLEDPRSGVIIRALQQIFDNLDNSASVKISFLEIIREQVFDLLNPSKKKVPLNVREVKPGCFRVVQLTEVDVTSVPEAVGLLSRGASVRSTEATALNSQSSRSHAIFSISLVTTDNGNMVTRKLNLVDLAGSENSNRTKTVGNRFEEAKSINMGLTVLSRVVTGLSKKLPHIPYRDSVLTKVLKESLESTCCVSMLACVSPGANDVNETISTLRFSNEAKQLKTKPLPARLLDSCKSSMARKQASRLGLLATPLTRANNTIHGTTPGSDSRNLKRPAFNRTIGTPGKRSKMERSYVRDRGQAHTVTSTVSKNILTDSLCDLSAVSMIEPPSETLPLPGTSSNVTNPLDITGLLSPLMRTMRENMQEEFQKLKTDLFKSKMVDSEAQGPRKTKTPMKMARNRATSSPNKTIIGLTDMTVDSDLVQSNVEDEVFDAGKENFISGAGLSFPEPPRSVNPRLRSVVESASPDLNRHSPPSLPQYDSPASSSTVRREEGLSDSPTIEEMERTLGINPLSPGLMFCSDNIQEPATVLKKSRKSSRRTTMCASELNETLREIQNIASSNKRRSNRVRAAAQGKYYGSPSQQEQENRDNNQGLEEEETAQFKHPLLIGEKKMEPVKQERHNRTILDFINIGNVKHLGGLPAVGPKTAFLIHQHRELHGQFEHLQELDRIPGIGRNFFKKFCKQNQLNFLEEAVGENTI